MSSPPLYDPAFDPPAPVNKKGGPHLDERADRGRLSFWLALLSACLFLGAGLHVHADRSRRIPVVTWEPLGMALAIAAVTAWGSAVGLALPALRRSDALLPWAAWAMLFAIQGAVWFLFYLGALYET